MEIPTDLETPAILIAVLLFLISLLGNLLQRRYYKTRMDRLINHDESHLNFLNGLYNSLGKLETACTFEMENASSPKEIGRSIHIARNQIKSSIADIEKNLRYFREYRAKEKARERHRKHMEKIREKRMGK
jgi:hypothetical protein